MCTIGAVFEPARGSLVCFKQCDLPEPRRFLEPARRVGPSGIRYLSFERVGASGPWAGVNERGVCFAGADAYLDGEVMRATRRHFDLAPGDVLAAYERILSDSASAAEGADHMCRFYARHDWPDIVLVADRHEALLVEHCPGLGFEVARLEAGLLVATNHFRLLPGAVSAADDPSTHLRLARAELILGGVPGLAGVAALLADQAEGPSERSICREAERPGDYFTQATFVARVGPGELECFYLLGGNPLTRPYLHCRDPFGAERRRVVASPVHAYDMLGVR
ncbi:MAG: hypothetical protein IT373_05105 [Polyangiaceae bacterium]|nr:hypothetical protein [Polyangiaceae bacterium]